jgi:hypothetical protein
MQGVSTVTFVCHCLCVCLDVVFVRVYYPRAGGVMMRDLWGNGSAGSE